MENGIPLHYKVYPGNTADSKTFIPFMLEIAKIYDVNNVTIGYDKGMSVNRNIRFLESMNWKYIISYRMKASNTLLKYVLDENEYITNGSVKYKSREIASFFNKKRPNGHVRNQIVISSTKRALKDKNGLVSYENLAGSKNINSSSQ